MLMEPYRPYKPARKKKKPVLLLLFLGVGIGFGAGSLINMRLDVLEAQRLAVPEVVPPVPAKEMRDTFARLTFKSETEVVEIAGTPVIAYIREKAVSWYYEGHEVTFVDGVVRKVDRLPPNIMKDKIATARINNGIEPQGLPIKRREILTPIRAQFLARQRTMGQIRDEFGPPTTKEVVDGREIWRYLDLVKENGNYVPFTIRFTGDLVATTAFK